MVRLGLVVLDGTNIEANAVAAANRTHVHLEAQVAELFSEAAEADRVEDRQHGAGRGDQLPRALAGRAERLPPQAAPPSRQSRTHALLALDRGHGWTVAACPPPWWQSCAWSAQP
jgi:hypothetical protein